MNSDKKGKTLKQCSLDKPCCETKLPYGWSTHGAWAPLLEIKKLEKERGNAWFNDKTFTGHEKAVWACENPIDALRYSFSAELTNAITHDSTGSKIIDPAYQPPDFLREEFQEFKEAISKPEDYLEKVDLNQATCVLEDGDGGYLYVKKREVRDELGG